MTGSYLEQEFGMPYIDITPMGVVETARCIRKIQQVINAQGADVYEEFIEQTCMYSGCLVLALNWLSEFDWQKGCSVWWLHPWQQWLSFMEMGFTVWRVPAKYDADWFREQEWILWWSYCHRRSWSNWDAIAKVEPSAIFGTQMEHVGKR